MVDLTSTVLQTLIDRLAVREQKGLLRQLRTANGLIDFCSNDYLGFARSPALSRSIQQANEAHKPLLSGATGSRLLAGHTQLVDELEHMLASFYATESALIFNSGFDANLGLLSSLPQYGDTLLTDELIHASMIDGARLCYATRQRFRHNDLNDLEAKLKQATGQVFVAVESVYSMDGDLAPLCELADLCDYHGAALLVDEAHATGIYADSGAGRVVELALQHRVLARVHTFGKALGVHGAAVVGSNVLRNYLINMARPFIYSTALPPHSLLAIGCAHQQLAQETQSRRQLHKRVDYFRQRVVQEIPQSVWTDSSSPIQCLIVPGNDPARQVARRAQQSGLDVRAILSPTVPVGQERLRICLHTYNSESEIDILINILKTADLSVAGLS